MFHRHHISLSLSWCSEWSKQICYLLHGFLLYIVSLALKELVAHFFLWGRVPYWNATFLRKVVPETKLLFCFQELVWTEIAELVSGREAAENLHFSQFGHVSPKITNLDRFQRTKNFDTLIWLEPDHEHFDSLYFVHLENDWSKHFLLFFNNYSSQNVIVLVIWVELVLYLADQAADLHQFCLFWGFSVHFCRKCGPLTSIFQQVFEQYFRISVC